MEYIEGLMGVVVTAVVFDLDSVVDYDVEAHDGWIEKAMRDCLEMRS